MSNKVSFVLNRNPPYMDTTVPYKRTKAEIEILLKSYWIRNVRWTTLEGENDTLEFIIEAKVEGVKKQLGVEVKPPHIVIKKKLHGKLVDTESYELVIEYKNESDQTSKFDKLSTEGYIVRVLNL
jgi:hypothetical protein